jgi:hypothetical protein
MGNGKTPNVQKENEVEALRKELQQKYCDEYKKPRTKMNQEATPGG